MFRSMKRMLLTALALVCVAVPANVEQVVTTPEPGLFLQLTIAPDVMPEVTPEVTSEPTMEIAPEPTSEFTPQIVATEVVDSEQVDDGVLRVYLRSMGSPRSLNLRLAGIYTVEHDAGFRFRRDAALRLFAQDGSVWMEIGALTMDMGSTVTFTRCAVDAGEENGIYISESEKDTIYCGDLSVSAEGDGLRAVLSIDIEEYLYGVVAYEMSDSFPIEALKAQAVAARTYAMQRKYSAGSRDYDVVDTTADQVFKGYDAAYRNVVTAVNATRGVVGTYNGGFAACYYTASNGGQVARANDIWGGSGDYDYILQRDDPFDLDNSRSLVNSVTFMADCSDNAALRQMLLEALDRQLPDQAYELVGIQAIEPAAPKVEDSRMYTQLNFLLNVRWPSVEESVETTPEPTTSGGNYHPFAFFFQPTPTPEPKWEERTVEVVLSVYDQIKDGLSIGLNGGDYELISVVETQNADGKVESFTLEMRRFGHGCGMSQRGAQWMAGHYSYLWNEILNFYYPGMTLERIDWQTPPLEALSAMASVGGYARPEPTPKPTPAPLPALEDGEIYAQVLLSDVTSTLNVRELPSTSARVIDRFENGRRVIVCGVPDAEGWVAIRTAELNGYVKIEYLLEE